MTTRDQLAEAWLIAIEYHAGQMYGKERPYIWHIIQVTEGVKRYCRAQGMHEEAVYDYMIVAILHDVLEDTSCTPAILLERGIPVLCISSVMLLSKNLDWVDQKTYIKRIWGNHKSLIVKREDTFKNLTQSQKESNNGRIIKYCAQLDSLYAIRD